MFLNSYVIYQIYCYIFHFPIKLNNTPIIEFILSQSFFFKSKIWNTCLFFMYQYLSRTVFILLMCLFMFGYTVTNLYTNYTQAKTTAIKHECIEGWPMCRVVWMCRVEVLYVQPNVSLHVMHNASELILPLFIMYALLYCSMFMPDYFHWWKNCPDQGPSEDRTRDPWFTRPVL